MTKDSIRLRLAFFDNNKCFKLKKNSRFKKFKKDGGLIEVKEEENNFFLSLSFFLEAKK